jgi:hypothetical protein
MEIQSKLPKYGMKFRTWLEQGIGGTGAVLQPQIPQPSLQQQMMLLRPQMAQAAQVVYDAWNQSGEDGDWEVGFGGICDQIAREMGDIIAQHIPDIELMDGGQDGDDHANLIVYNNQEAYLVDISPSVYETGGGMSWQKIDGVQIRPDDVEIYPLNLQDITGGY